MATKQQEAVDRLTRAQRVVAVLVGALSLTLAGLAFTGMFTAVRTEMVPFFHGLAWIVPAGVDIGILALISAGILLEWLAMPMPALRWVAMVFMGASVWLNVAAADGDKTGAVGHAALPVLFIACIEAVRHAVRHTAGMANGTVRDGIPAARWILAFPSSFRMFRRMVLQRIYSYPDAAALEISRRHAIAQLRAVHGPQWKRMAPGDLVWMLQKGIAVGDAIDRVAELTGQPAPSPAIVPAAVRSARNVPARRAQNAAATVSQNAAVSGQRSGTPRSGDAPGTSAVLTNESAAPALPAGRLDPQHATAFRSESDLQDEALAILAAHKAATGERMTTAELGKALHVAKKRAVLIRAEVRDREEAA